MPSNETEIERELGLAAAQWQAILDTVQDAVIGITREGTVTLFNACAERMFGYASEEVVGRNVRMLMPEPYHEQHDGYLRSYLATGDAKAIGRVRQVAARRKTGDVFPIELSVSETRVRQTVQFNAIIRDVSERERALLERNDLIRRLHQSQRLADIGVMTARIAHDVGNPLAGVLMTAQLMLRRIERDASNLRLDVEILLSTARRLEAIVYDFKDFAREQRLSLQPVALTAFLQEVVAVWRPEADDRGVALLLDDVVDLTVRIDRAKCQRVFDNLLKNASRPSIGAPARCGSRRRSSCATRSESPSPIPGRQLRRGWMYSRSSKRRSHRGPGWGCRSASRSAAPTEASSNLPVSFRTGRSFT